MPDTGGHLYGPAPTPEEIAAAMRRARQLRSEVLSEYLTIALGTLGRSSQRTHRAGARVPESMARHDIAPSPSARRSLWGMLPGPPALAHALWNRVSRT